jgi:hypothetical protein
MLVFNTTTAKYEPYTETKSSVQLEMEKLDNKKIPYTFTNGKLFINESDEAKI